MTWWSGMNLSRSQGHGRWASGQGVGPLLEVASLRPLGSSFSVLPGWFHSLWLRWHLPREPRCPQSPQMTCMDLNLFPESAPSELVSTWHLFTALHQWPKPAPHKPSFVDTAQPHPLWWFTCCLRNCSETSCPSLVWHPCISDLINSNLTFHVLLLHRDPGKRPEIGNLPP